MPAYLVLFDLGGWDDAPACLDFFVLIQQRILFWRYFVKIHLYGKSEEEFQHEIPQESSIQIYFDGRILGIPKSILE